MGESGNSERLLLASASPRRRELLARIGVNFEVVVSRFDENSLRHLSDPETYVSAAAAGKAEEVASRTRDGVVLGVDTDVISPDGEILGKPADSVEACRILNVLSGRLHRVLSGVCLIKVRAGTIIQRELCVVETAVLFQELSEKTVTWYVAGGEPMDKAGAYGIQGGGMALISRIDGDLSNVIGLPLPALTAMLPRFGISLWNPTRRMAAV